MLQSDDIFYSLILQVSSCFRGVLTSHEATGCDPVSHDPSFIHTVHVTVWRYAHCAKKSSPCSLPFMKLYLCNMEPCCR
jgi:hypothetical protein